MRSAEQRGGGRGRQSRTLTEFAQFGAELVTNAYRHTRGPCSLRITASGDGRLRVGVWDSHPHIPEPFSRPSGHRTAPAPPDAVGGRGLHLVREYAVSWGAWSLGEDLLGCGAGKLLWFEM